MQLCARTVAEREQRLAEPSRSARSRASASWGSVTNPSASSCPPSVRRSIQRWMYHSRVHPHGRTSQADDARRTTRPRDR